MNSNNSPEITVSIVSYNTRELLRLCLAALQAREDEGEASLQIIVADNGSIDGSVGMVRNEFPRVLVIETGGNLGYGRANNRAFEHAQGRYFFVLNSDTEVQPGALSLQRDFLDAHPDVGATGARLIYPDGRPQTSYGCDPSFKGIFDEQLGIDKVRARLGRGASTQNDEVEQSGHEAPREVEQICGACQFVRREAYAQVGGFDPAYFMYHEDVDLNIRLRRAGWKLFFLSAARIVHHLGASSERDWQTRARMISALNKSRYYYYYQHEGKGQGQALKAMFLAGAALRLVSWTFMALLPSQRGATVRQKVKLFREVLRQTTRMSPHNPRA
jgi:GT2 family glycosyltransferase